jgi:hypothetical protein
VQSRGMIAPPCYVTDVKIRHLERHANEFNLILIRAVIDRLMRQSDYCCIPLHLQLVRRLFRTLLSAERTRHGPLVEGEMYSQ